MNKSTPIQRIALTGFNGHPNGMLASRISANMWRIREANGLSRTDLAQRINPPTSSQQIERLEKGQRRLTIEWIEKVANGLKVDPAELMASDGERYELTSQVAGEMAWEMARFVLGGGEPDPVTVEGLSILIQDLSATFADDPQARRDPHVARPVVRALVRKLDKRS
jgi:transcriptional regulator with XRE-family HTH domain